MDYKYQFIKLLFLQSLPSNIKHQTWSYFTSVTQTEKDLTSHPVYCDWLEETSQTQQNEEMQAKGLQGICGWRHYHTLLVRHFSSLVSIFMSDKKHFEVVLVVKSTNRVHVLHPKCWYISDYNTFLNRTMWWTSMLTYDVGTEIKCLVTEVQCFFLS